MSLCESESVQYLEQSGDEFFIGTNSIVPPLEEAGSPYLSQEHMEATGVRSPKTFVILVCSTRTWQKWFAS